MKKRGIGTFTLVILVILSGLIVTSATFLILNRDQLFLQQEDIQAEDTDITQAEEAIECTDYISKEDCESDPYNAGNSEQLGWTELNCALAEINCGCKWNEEESKCKISMISSEEEEANETEESNESEVIEDLFFDLEALNLSLVNKGCKSSNITNDTFCNVSVSGIIKNVGTGTIDKEFLIQFVDGGDIYHVINIFTVNTVEPGEEKSFSFIYKNILEGNYWIQIKVY